MTDLVKCDRCGTPFSIQTAGIRSTWSGDYMVQYFTCPGCHHRYQILTTDTELRQTVQQHKKIAAKIRMGKSKFLSTPSARRATVQDFITARRSEDFYPRPPRGGRLHTGHHAGCAIDISIHALREEGDFKQNKMPGALSNFYPRPPRGGRQNHLILSDIPTKFLSTPSARRATHSLLRFGAAKVFLSTPSARRATAGRRFTFQHQHISIHALREEGDSRR